jgi:Flp pilus assembly pilin Flp
MKQSMEPEAKITRRNHPIYPLGEGTSMDLIIKLTWDEGGASAVEYALLLALISVVIVSAVTTFGIAVRGLFEKVVF